MIRIALLSLLLAATLRAGGTPNIVIIYADDLGYGDLGCYGHPTIRTPNLDRMAAEGMRFTQFYSAAEVCTPSRAALLTGRYPIRSGMCHSKIRVLRNNSTGGLPAAEITLAELLKERGYATACIGKWHLGVWSNNPANHPMKHGFEFQFGLPHSNDMNPNPGNPKLAGSLAEQNPAWWNAPLYRGMELIEQPADQTMLTRRYTEEAKKFIEVNKSRPFFLYFPHTFPHTPLFASKDFRGASPRGIYGDVVEELDWSVGQVLDALRNAGIDKNTLVFFSSDNGPWLIMNQQGGSAGLLREGKGSTWEGGMRVPGIAWWPGKVPAGKVCRDVACTMDIFTTGAKIAGAVVPQDRAIDGLDITPLLFEGGKVAREAFFYYRGTELFAARVGRWKAHFITQSAYGKDGPAKHEPPELYDLENDPSERFDVAADHAEVLRQIEAVVAKHRAGVQPVPNQLEAVMEVK
ncbi:MAG: sulfatase [Verrucomicrobiaceae bacterium]|nr:sulfatase [Verrucomicrobiaceae bacterium]